MMTWAVLVSVVCFLGGVAFAQFAKTEDAIKYRQSVMFLIGQHFGRMGAVVRGEQPYDKDAFDHNAALVGALYKLPLEAFMAPGSAKDSRMKAEALTQKDKFAQLHKATQMELDKLASVAKGGDLNPIKAQFGRAGASCKACHDTFRSQ